MSEPCWFDLCTSCSGSESCNRERQFHVRGDGQDEKDDCLLGSCTRCECKAFVVSAPEPLRSGPEAG